MDWTKRTMALAVVGAMVAPSLAWAADYPRAISIEGLDCIEKLGRDGSTVETWCQTGEQMRLVSVDPTGATESPPASSGPTTRSEQFRWDPRPAAQPRSSRYQLANVALQNPVRAAQTLADQDRSGGRYFGGGFALGILLGPLGWLVGGVVAGNSDVYLPPADGAAWSPSDSSQFAISYTSAIRSKRIGNAIGGGIVGTVVAGVVIYAIVSSSDSR